MNFKVNKIDVKLFAKTACLNNEKLCVLCSHIF